MTADGFFRTGDVAILQADGQVRIVDRMKDMILVSGFNVYPNEVEDVLAAHPAVLECAVVGAPSEETGEMVVAHVVLKDPSVSTDILRALRPHPAHRLQGAPPRGAPRDPAEDQCRQGAAADAARRDAAGLSVARAGRTACVPVPLAEGVTPARRSPKGEAAALAPLSAAADLWVVRAGDPRRRPC
ncbi:AMP-binding enzyme [Methylobacterium oryzae CBMB20]